MRASWWMVGWVVLTAAIVHAGEDLSDFTDFSDLDLQELLDSEVYSATGSFAGVVVSASRHEQDIGEAPSAITVITREQIENTHCVDLVCLIGQVPEVEVLRIRPMFPVVGARALVDEAADKILVLLDGQEINTEIFGLVLWQMLPIHLEDVDRIEVIRGPGSALYGANAHSMVVSIFTRKDTDRPARAFLAAGERDRTSLSLGLSHRAGEWSLQATGGLETAGHWMMRGERVGTVGRLRLGAQREGDWGVTVARGAMYYADGTVFSLLGPTRIEDGLFAQLFLGQVGEHFQAKVSSQLMDFAIPMGTADLTLQNVYVGRMPARVDLFYMDVDAEAQARLEPWAGNLLLTGASYRWGMGQGDHLDPDTVHQHRLGVFVHDEQRLWKRLVLVGSLRADYNSITPFTLSPRLAAVVEPVEDQFLRLAAGQAFRKPSFFNSSLHVKDVEPAPGFETLGDLFHDQVGNEDLENESITSVEVGYYGRFLDSSLVLESDVFYNRYRDTIILHVDFAYDAFGLPDLANSILQFRNNGREVDSLGGTLSVTWRWRNRLRAFANYTFRHSVYAATPSGVASVGEGEKGDRVPWEPAHLFNAGFYYLPRMGLRYGLSLSGSSAADKSVSSGSALDPRVVIHRPAAWVLSGFAAWRVPLDRGYIEAGVRVFNLLNNSYTDFPPMQNARGFWHGGQYVDRQVLAFLRGSL